MASDKQIRYYEYLCEQTYVEPEEDYADWGVSVMSDKIKELIAIRDGTAESPGAVEVDDVVDVDYNDAEEPVDDDYFGGYK